MTDAQTGPEFEFDGCITWSATTYPGVVFRDQSPTACSALRPTGQVRLAFPRPAPRAVLQAPDRASSGFAGQPRRGYPPACLALAG